MELEAPSQRNRLAVVGLTPRTSTTSKQGKVTAGRGLSPWAPGICLQGQQESRYRDYQTGGH